MSSLLLATIYSFGAFYIWRRHLPAKLDPATWCFLGSFPVLLFQSISSILPAEGGEQWLVLYLSMLLIAVVLVALASEWAGTSYVILEETREDYITARLCALVGISSFIYLVYKAGGVYAYANRVEGVTVVWEGITAALAYFSGLSIFASFYYLVRSVSTRLVNWIGLSFSFILLAPALLPAVLLFKRTSSFIVGMYIIIALMMRVNSVRMRKYVISLYCILPFASYLIIYGIPYLRTQYYLSGDYGRNLTFEDYRALEPYSEIDYGAAVVGAIAEPCGELGYGRRLVSQLVSVFVPKASGLKDGLLEMLDFHNVATCATPRAPDNVFLTGIAEAALDFGYAAPLFLGVLAYTIFRSAGLFGGHAYFAYMSYLCTLLPIFLLWGPMYVIVSIMPVILLKVMLRIISPR